MISNLDNLIAPLSEDVERAGAGANIGGLPCGALWAIIGLFLM